MAEALFWTAPTERLKILRQAKAGEGVGGAVGELSVILREQGVRGLYVGAGATAARQASSVAVRFSAILIMYCVIRPGCRFRLLTTRYLALHSVRDAVLRK